MQPSIDILNLPSSSLHSSPLGLPFSLGQNSLSVHLFNNSVKIHHRKNEVG